MHIDDHRLRPLENNLTLVRLVLASAVIWTHSVWRITGRMGADELAGVLGAPISSFSVDGFFFLSGFLVYGSLLRRGSAVDFLAARLARLWPGLAVSILLTVAIGGLVTRAPGLAYLRGDTADFLVGNLTLTAGKYKLTGVMCGAAPCTVNGSLWTITWEMRCYLLLILALLTGLARPAAMRRFVLPASLVFAIAFHLPGVEATLARHLGSGIVYNLAQVDRLWTMFALGIAAYLARDRLILSWPALLALLGALVLSEAVFPIPHLRSVFVGYAVLCAGFLSARRGAISGRWPDYSYGMYIYAFPVMMGIAALIPFGAHPALALATLAATLPLAALSWHLVEKPALELVRSRRLRRRGDAPAPSAAPGGAGG